MSQLFFTQLFSNKEFVEREFAPHIPFNMVYNVRLTQKAWSELVDINIYIKSLVSSLPTTLELEDYKKYGGCLKFNTQVMLTIIRGRYYLVEKFMKEEEFDILCYEGIFGVYKASKIEALNMVSVNTYNKSLIVQVTGSSLKRFDDSCEEEEKVSIFADLALFFLTTSCGSKFMETHKLFKTVAIRKGYMLQSTIFWNSILEDRLAALEFYRLAALEF